MYHLLKGMKILDLTRLLPGAFATMMLADLGAEVLKVEDPWEGDYMRELGPKHGAASVYYLAICRNKKSMKLNLKEKEGKEILYRMARDYNILAESFRPGVMDKLGLGYEKISTINPALVYCSLSGYGQDGPYRLRPGHDLNYMALAGALGLTGKPGEAPPVLGVQVGDIGGGALMAAMGILAAYISSQRTGKGQYIDVSIYDGLLAWNTLFITEYLNTGREPKRGCEQLNGGQVNYNVYETKDGKFISLGAIEPKFWEAFCRAGGREDLLPYFENSSDEAYKAVKEFFLGKTRAEIIEIYQEVDTCLEPVQDISEVMQHPHAIQRHMLQELEAAEGGIIKTVAHPLKLPGAPVSKDLPPPLHGQHTRQVMSELGYPPSEIDELLSRNIIG